MLEIFLYVSLQQHKKHNTMKKRLLLLLSVLAATAMQAQNEMYNIMYHDTVGSDAHINFMQLRNGDFVANLFVLENTGHYNYIPQGSMFYKVSPNTLAITDSLLVEDTVPYYLFARNPRGEGNIRARFEYREDCDSTFLRISHFSDDDLHSNPDEDIVAPLCDGYSPGGRDSQVDRWGDLIISYAKEHNMAYDLYLARVGLDGTLKQQALWIENNMNGFGYLGVLKESPLTFYQWSCDDSYNTNLVVFEMDSLFHSNIKIINCILSEEILDPYNTAYEYFSYNGDTKVIPAGGDDILVAAKYVSDTNFHGTAEYGVVVAKYNLRTMQPKGYIVFNDNPGGNYAQNKCLDIKMMTDGTVYLLYKENGYPQESIMIVKMDTDLNVDWKRFCKTDNIALWSLTHPVLFEDGQGVEKGIAWMGGGTMAGHDYNIFFQLNHDGPVSLEKYGVEVRPYAFYPNPAKDLLHMSYSPDVQPKQIELYDLQGRLVGTQRSGLERIDMSRLPSGTYTMRVTMVDGKIYSDKVVKE